MENDNIPVLGTEEFESIAFTPTPLVISEPTAKGLLITETEYADYDCIWVVRRRLAVGQRFRLAANAPEGFEEAVWTVMEILAQGDNTKVLAKPDVEELAEIEQRAFVENRILRHRNLSRFIIGA